MADKKTPNKTPNKTPKTQGASAKGGSKKAQGISATQGASAKGVKKRERKDEQVHTEPGDNAKYISHSMRLYNLPKCCMQSLEEVQDRVSQYFTICTEDDMKPSVAGLALALGVDKSYLWELRVGRKGKNPDIANTLKKAVDILDLQMVDYMQNGKINPVSGIFLMKNNFGYADKQEVTIKAEQPLGDIQNDAELQKKYLEDIVAEGHTVEVSDP